MSLEVGKNVVCVSNSLDPGEMSSYLASHLDPSCLHMAPWLQGSKLFAYGTLVVHGENLSLGILIFQYQVKDNAS